MQGRKFLTPMDALRLSDTATELSVPTTLLG
jgi:hypothetical protein